jgi:hypothetical protein
MLPEFFSNPPNLVCWCRTGSGFAVLVELIPVRRYNWRTRKKDWGRAVGAPRDIQRDAAEPDVRLRQSVITRLKGRSDYHPRSLPAGDPTFGGKLRIES